MRTKLWLAIAGACCVGCTDVQAQPTEPVGGYRVVSEQSALKQPALTRTVRRAKSNGAVVDLGWTDELSQTFLMVATDSATPDVALLTYSRVAYEPNSNVCTPDPVLGTYCRLTRVTFESGSGYIPASNVEIGTNTAWLDTSLTAATDLVYNRCVYDDVAGTNECSTEAPAGLITVAWEKTNTDYVKFFGITETKMGPETTRVSGTRKQYSALSNGSVLAVAVVNQPGNIGQNTSTTIEITRTP